LAVFNLAVFNLAVFNLAVANFAEATEAEMLPFTVAGRVACPLLIRDFFMIAMVDPPGNFRISFRPTL
jgi:hypothetical protein